MVDRDFWQSGVKITIRTNLGAILLLSVDEAENHEFGPVQVVNSDF